jgi:hypothetical protein
MLPDVALLEIFDFYVHENEEEFFTGIWYPLVHVCRTWRKIVFGSTQRLNLQLFCNNSTPVRKTLDVWPLLPIAIWDDFSRGVDNIIAALEHHDRICQLGLGAVPSSQLKRVLAVTQQTLPALTWLRLWFRDLDEAAPVVPASFLGGSAPQLQKLFLDSIPFPGLPKLLLSATHLVDITLWGIPYSGYISPEAMASCLPVLTSLETLDIGFKSPQSRPDQRRRPPPTQTRALLPVLTKLSFRGVSEYLEDLVARIDAPLLDKLEMTFFHQLIFDTPQVTQFINRTPKFKAYDEARVDFSSWDASVRFDGALELTIICSRSDWQLSSLANVCSSIFPQALISAVKFLSILELGALSQPPWQDDIESGQWLELLHPFTAVKDLHISSEFAPRIAPALQEFARERATDVLPALQNLHLEEPLPSAHVQETIGQFVSARQLAIIHTPRY